MFYEQIFDLLGYLGGRNFGALAVCLAADPGTEILRFGKAERFF